jgi:hypothetical protein
MSKLKTSFIIIMGTLTYNLERFVRCYTRIS